MPVRTSMQHLLQYVPMKYLVFRYFNFSYMYAEFEKQRLTALHFPVNEKATQTNMNHFENRPCHYYLRRAPINF